MPNKVYVISDLLLFDDKRREELDFESFEEMNKFVVQRWNHTVDKLDAVIVMGVVCGGAATVKTIKEVISKLNGKLTMIARDQNQMFAQEQWKEIGFTNVWNVDMCSGAAGLVYCSKKLHTKEQLSTYNVVIVDNSTPMKETIEGNRMKGDALIWGYTPLNTEAIQETYNNMKEFLELNIEDTETRTELED